MTTETPPEAPVTCRCGQPIIPCPVCDEHPEDGFKGWKHDGPWPQGHRCADGGIAEPAECPECGALAPGHTLGCGRHVTQAVTE